MSRHASTQSSGAPADHAHGATDRQHRHDASHDKKGGKNGKDGGHRWRAFGSLDHEIGDIERRIRGRRAAATLHAAAVEQGVREKLSSPIALAVAAGAGFAAGHWGVFRKRSVEERADDIADEIAEAGHDAANEVKSARRGIDGPGLLTQIMNGLSLASSIMAMLPRQESGRDGYDDRADTGFEPAAAGD